MSQKSNHDKKNCSQVKKKKFESNHLKKLKIERLFNTQLSCKHITSEPTRRWT